MTKSLTCEEKISQILKYVLTALKVVHDADCVHRDIKHENIIV